MVDSISKIQQLLAEAKFVEAQLLTEKLLNQDLSFQDHEMVLELYFDCLTSQNKFRPVEQLIKLIQIKVENDSSDIDRWFNQFTKNELEKYEYEISLLKINFFHKRGRLELLYNSIRDFQNYLYQYRIPAVPSFVEELIKNFFPLDFHLKVQSLAFDLLRMDLPKAEEKVKELIINSILNSSQRERKLKLNLLITVISSQTVTHQIEIYKSLASLYLEEKISKKNIKKIIECLIYVDDFRLQILLIKIITKIDIQDATKSFVTVIKKNSRYNFVFIEKYFPELKYFFIQIKKDHKKEEPQKLIDLQLEEKKKPESMVGNDDYRIEFSEHENLLTKLIKIQNFDASTVLDLAVNFIQSELFVTAIDSVKSILEMDIDKETKLKAYYLLASSYLKTKDYRAALDCCLTAMKIAETKNDILSFLYGQAEAYMNLKDKKNAKRTLEKIKSIDANYRLVKEKLEIIDAI